MDALYETMGGDAIISMGPLRHAMARIELPGLKNVGILEQYHMKHTTVPPWIVINIQIPVRPKAIFGARTLPPTVNALFYLRLKDETARNVEALESGLPDVPGAIKLLHRWCRDAAHNDSLRGCLKLIGTGQNFSEIGAPPFVHSYNSKPVLLAGAGFSTKDRAGISQLYRGPNYIQIDVDVASHFTYVATNISPYSLAPLVLPLLRALAHAIQPLLRLDWRCIACAHLGFWLVAGLVGSDTYPSGGSAGPSVQCIASSPTLRSSSRRGNWMSCQSASSGAHASTRCR